MRSVVLALLLTQAAWCALVTDVRAQIAKQDFAEAMRLIQSHRKANGVNPENILAYSWLGRGAQALKKWDEANKYANETRELCLAELKKRKLDEENDLPLALGASIEVH